MPARGPDGTVYVLQGKERKAIIEGLDRPYGLALQDGYLYVGEPESVKRYKYDAKAMTAGPGPGDRLAQGLRRRTLDAQPALLAATASASASAPVRAPTSRPAKIPPRRHQLLQPRWQRPRDLCLRHAQPHRHALVSRHRHSLGGGAGARRTGRRPGPRLLHAHPEGRLLRLAVRLRRPERRSRATKASARTWWPRRFRATCCWARTSPCWISSSTPVSSSPRNIRAAPSSPSTAPGTAPSASASPSPSFRSRTASPPAP